MDPLWRRLRIEAQRQAARKTTPKCDGDQNILIGDMGLLEDRLEVGSVDLFLSDPVYQDVRAYTRLAELAAGKLKPGGFCLAYTGHMRLPDVLAAMGGHLAYWWTFAVRFADQPKAIHARHIQNRWKPVVAFARPPLKASPDWLADLVDGSGRDKTYHEWGKGEAEAAYLIQRLTAPGALVVDPYCGGAQVPAAAKAAGRRWLATEVNRATALVARRRLAEMVCEESGRR